MLRAEQGAKGRCRIYAVGRSSFRVETLHSLAGSTFHGPFSNWRDRINQQSLGRGRGFLFPAPAMPTKGGTGSCVSFREFPKGLVSTNRRVLHFMRMSNP